MEESDFNLTRFPAEREIVVDAGYLAGGRHIIYALLEVDVSDARHMMDELSIVAGQKISFTAFIVASFAQAIKANPRCIVSLIGAGAW